MNYYSNINSAVTTVDIISRDMAPCLTDYDDLWYLY